MPKLKVIAAVGLLVICTTAAQASYPPIKYHRGRIALAAACANLGARGEGRGLALETGPYSCRDVETGNTVVCTEMGLCTDYSGDPRWRKIRDVLNGAPLTPAGQL